MPVSESTASSRSSFAAFALRRAALPDCRLRATSGSYRSPAALSRRVRSAGESAEISPRSLASDSSSSVSARNRSTMASGPCSISSSDIDPEGIRAPRIGRTDLRRPTAR